MRTIVPLTWDLFVRTAVREVMNIIPPPAKTRRNALTAAKTTCHDRVTAKFGRKKKKLTKNITYLEAKKQFESQASDLDFTKIVQSLSSKPE